MTEKPAWPEGKLAWKCLGCGAVHIRGELGCCPAGTPVSRTLVYNWPGFDPDTVTIDRGEKHVA